MKITAALDAASRAKLQAHLAKMEGLQTTHLNLLRELTGLNRKRIDLLAAAVAAEKKADAGDLDASRELLAMRDQLARLDRGSEAKSEAIGETLRRDMNRASAQALLLIQELLVPEIGKLEAAIVEALAPFVSQMHVAEATAHQCDALIALIYSSRRHVTVPWEDIDNARAQAASYAQRLACILKGGEAWEFEGFKETKAKPSRKAA